MREEDECKSILKKLSSKKFVLFAKRGNAAIRLALKLGKSLGLDKVLLQDQGGWITYRQFCKKEKLKVVELKTNFGLVKPDTLKDYSHCILLINSMPAYAALHEMKEVEKACIQQRIFLINDTSGSIGTNEAMFGNIILASFAKDKPVNLQGHGGFVATDNYEYFEFLEKNNQKYNTDFKELLKRLERLEKRLEYYRLIRNRVLDDLRDYDIIHRKKRGINVIAKYDSELERERLINYCSKAKLEFTLCPRDIRVKEKAVSIEIKRR